LDSSRIRELHKNVALLENNRQKIIDVWLEDEEVRAILQKHEVDLEMFAVTYALPVLNYFIGVVHEENMAGNCPVITKLLEYLKDKNISVAELFIICINFRKSMIMLLFSKNVMSATMYSNVSYIFDANFRGVLNLFVETVASARAETKRMYDLSTQDYLTKIYNRKKFDELLAVEVEEATLLNKKFALILLDIDHFKQINDTFGHDMGDTVLIQLSNIIKHFIRGSDIVARWGGEEFVILMPQTEVHDACTKADLIREEIAVHNFTCMEKVTCSFGVTVYTLGDTPQSIFKKADEALYSSKKAGRNRVTLAS